MRLLAALISATLVLGFAACGDDDTVTVEPPGTTTEPGVTTTTTAGEVLEPVGDFSTEPQRSDDYATNETALLTDIRVAQHDGFTRVVFELDGEQPGWIAEYQEPPVTEDPSGRTVAVEGDAFLRITMSAASAVELRGEEPVVTFEPERVAGPGELVNEVVDAGDFEAVMTWVIGLDTEAPFTVETFADPTRVVVDIEH